MAEPRLVGLQAPRYYRVPMARIIPPAQRPAAFRWSIVFWTFTFLVLVGFQGWKTQALFGIDPWQRLFDRTPIVSGRHALHLYHGYLGACSLRERGTLCCYDPAFQAGYPKSPVFDSGSRPAELFLSVAGARYDPSAYKLGLASCCLL